MKNFKYTELFVRIGAGLTTIALAGTIAACSKKKVEKTDGETLYTTSTTTDELPLSTFELNNFALEKEIPEVNTRQYGETTGSVDKSKVTKKNGKYYATKEDAEKSSKVGTSIDTKGGTVVIAKDGKSAHTKTNEYEIKNDKGEVTSTGKVTESTKRTEDGTLIPNGYVEENGKIIDEETSKTSTEVTTDIKDSEGNVIFSEGDRVDNEDLENYKDTKEERTEEVIPTEDTWTMGEDGYLYKNGVAYAIDTDGVLKPVSEIVTPEEPQKTR